MCGAEEEKNEPKKFSFFAIVHRMFLNSKFAAALIIFQVYGIQANSPSVSPSLKPAAASTKSSICLYGGFCDGNSVCISGSKCIKQSPYYSQCMPDFTNENSSFAAKNGCSLMYGYCGATKKCCNGAFSCSVEQKCVPVEPPLCSNPAHFSPTAAPSVAPTVMRSAAPTINGNCDTSKVNLRDFEAWKREEGLWVGEYSFYGANGDPYKSAGWPYPYQPYGGFIFINVSGNHLRQRNIFVYPPQDPAKCSNDTRKGVIGAGRCGVNGNEKIFAADQFASDCAGNLGGPYPFGMFTLDTYTNIYGSDTVVYQVRYRAINITTPYFKFIVKAGAFNQNQITSLPGNGIRVRTAQSFNPDQTPQAASFYRETKVANLGVWKQKLAALRAKYNILPSDYCGYDQLGQASYTTCEQHFGCPVV